MHSLRIDLTAHRRVQRCAEAEGRRVPSSQAGGQLTAVAVS